MSRPVATRGSVRLPLVTVGVLLIGSLFFVLGPLSSGPEEPAAVRVDPAPRPAAPASTGIPRNPGPHAAVDEPAREAEAEAPDPARFQGTGSIRGSVGIPQGPAPDLVVVAISPSRSLAGRERAVSRELELTSEPFDFRFDDLPLGGYDVAARAEGRNGLAVPVLLSRGNASPWVSVHLTPAGVLSGFVVDAELEPLEGLAIVLQPELDGLGPERDTVTDAAGRYVYESVLDGPYRVLIGGAPNPIETVRIVFRAPSLHVPRVELPKLSRMLVLVLNGNYQPVEGARVRGSGRNGGQIDALTNRRGEVWAHQLPAGKYTLYAESEERTARKIVTLSEGEKRQVEMRFEW